MSSAIEGLKPEAVWRYFAEVVRIPRGSGNEAAIGRYVLDTAAKLGLEAQQDKVGNVIIRKPASPGRESARGVCLQGHLDMVCEKNADKVHDFKKDPIELVRQDNIIMANGTTLGADNGIAIAAGLALMEDNTLEHGPLELLLTIDEETGLTGAGALEPGFVHSRTLMNLDSEEEGALYVGCAGGRDTRGEWKLDLEAQPANTAACKVTVKGLKGGHSGLDIDKGRGNAVKLLNRVLMGLADLGARLSSIDGGNKHNAIPREAEALVFVPKKKLEEAEALVAGMSETLRAEVATADPGLTVGLEQLKGKKGKVMKKGLQKKLQRVIAAMPHGVIKMSADIPGLVETSTNLAVVKTDRKAVKVQTSQRSSVDSEIAEIVDTVAAVLDLGGADVQMDQGYPGWKPNLDSDILNLSKSTFASMFGHEPEVKAIHAGLECGIIGEKYPGMDMVSLGPTLEAVHSPDEKIYIDTVERFWDLLRRVLSSVQ